MIGARLPVVAIPDHSVDDVLVKPSFGQEVMIYDVLPGCAM